MADLISNHFLAEILKGNIDCDASGDTFNLSLHTSSMTPDKDMQTYSDLTNEVGTTGTNYSTGGYAFTSSNNSVSEVTASDWAYFDIGEDASWASSTITARYGALYVQTTPKELVCIFDFTEDKSSSNGTFTVQFNANGIVRLNQT